MNVSQVANHLLYITVSNRIPEWLNDTKYRISAR